MVDKLFDLDDIRDATEDAQVKQARKHLYERLRASVCAETLLPGLSPKRVEQARESALRDLALVDGIPCGHCKQPIRDFFYREAAPLGGGRTTTMLVCPFCHQSGKKYVQET